jgi:thioredoxin-related protein
MTQLIKIVSALFVLSSTLLALEWAKDLDTAIITAQKEHKNIMVLVEGQHCGWCKKMKEDTLSDSSIEKRLEKYVVVKVMREDGNAMAKLPPVNGVPTTFFMKENKAILEDIVGYFNVQDFTSYMNDIETKLK